MKCDIVLTVWNEPQLTKNCIGSLIKHTRYPYRIIIIDNGSREETKEYLQGLRSRADIEISLIRNEQNLGFVKGVNQGLRASNAPYVCLLNNDTLLSNGWLAEMVEIAERNPQIGMLSPSSNSFGQYLPKGDSVETYAEGLKALKGQWQEMGQCGGFCMLIKREVIDKIGFLDEVFGVGFCEETDFCRRAQKAGFGCARAKASYVYHQNGTSFRKRNDRQQIFKKSHDIFFRRWGRPLRIAYLTGNYPDLKQDKINEICLQAARDHHQVWLFFKKSLFKSHSIPDHFNVRFFWFNNYFYRILCICKILKRKRKKKMELIFSEDKFLASILKRLQFFHEADVLFAPSLKKAKELWKQKSVYT